MAPRDPERSAHGLKVRFDDSSYGAWAWVEERHETGSRYSPVAESDDKPELLRAWGEKALTMWVASADPDLAEDRWFCVGACSTDSEDMREALRELVLRRMRAEPTGPFPRRFGPAWAARLAVFFGAGEDDWDHAGEIADEHQFILEDLMWRTRDLGGRMSAVMNRSSTLLDLEALRKQEDAEIAGWQDVLATTSTTVFRLRFAAPFVSREPLFSRLEQRGKGSYGQKTGG